MRVFSLLLLALHAGTAVELEAFDRLVNRYGIHSRVKLSQPPGGERGLFTIEPVKAGEPVLAVPFDLCLVCMAEPGDERIKSPWDAPHRHAKDTLLACKLLHATADVGDGKAAAASAAAVTLLQQSFWQEWKQMLPAPETLAHPVTLDDTALRELQDTHLAEAALLQQARVDVVLAKDFPSTSSTQRRWAAALCSSRPFTIPAEHFTLAAFVPFIDMANHHDTEPNCEVQGRGYGGPRTGEEGGSAGDPAAAAAFEVGEQTLSAAFKVVGLVATRDLDAGEEIFISYFDAAPNSHVFSRFGFVAEGGNCHDRLAVPGLEALAPLSSEAVRATTKANAGRWDAVGPLLEAALLSMPLTREPSQGAAAEFSAAEQIQQLLCDVAARDFETALEEDEAALADPERASVHPMILRYRAQRKRLFDVALDVLEAHKRCHPP